MPTPQQRRFQRQHQTVKPAPGARSVAGVPLPLQALAYLAVFAAAVAVYLPTLRHGFLINWDDPTYVVNNPLIRGWSRENLIEIFTKPYFSNFLPLHLVSYMVDYSLWGLNPFGYHLQSVILNGVNAALALLVTRRLFGDFTLAFLAALLYAVHPSHVEAVAWISIRKDLLSTTFLLLTVYFYLRATGSRSLDRGSYAASVAAFTLGLLSKVSIVALPLFLLLLDLLQTAGRRRLSWKAALANKIPYGLVGLMLVRLNMLAQAKGQTYAHDPANYLMVKGHAVWNYLALLTGLPPGRPIYDAPQFAPDLLPAVANLAGIVVLPAALWVAHRRGWRVMSLGAGWVFVLLLPAIFFPLVTYMADRYLYAPSLGFCWLLGAGIVWMGRRSGGIAVRAGVVAFLTAIPFAGFVYRTMEYCPVWAGSESLWSYALARSEDYRIRNNLAQARLDEKRWADAERLYREGSRFENYISHQGLAAVYYNTNRYAEAEREIERAVEIARKGGLASGKLADLEYARGQIYWVQSQPQKAIDAWEAALRANPRDERAPLTTVWVGVAESRLGNEEASQEAFRQAIEKYRRTGQPVTDAYFAIGTVELNRNNFLKAAEWYRLAYRESPHEAKVAFFLGRALARGGSPAEAMQLFKRIAEGEFSILSDSQFTMPDVYVQMGVAAQTLGHNQEAIGYWEEALRRAPDHPERDAILASIAALRRAAGH
ncbi:MAG: tetratricopeptide repeat protein [Candidatus Eisenbacteria bacterium]|uniref:Tetratricopeptide repeat protein n=1 Tax=Eiseniibacteriota bacterium TaxID=2212470 RepID=A0A538TRS4_UNCEI|nr:MAG: tetratricopeptide repeat protein [Candidatus Eisenbacteria bacterium]